jgi:hypothetical protein
MLLQTPFEAFSELQRTLAFDSTDRRLCLHHVVGVELSLE